VTYLRTDLFTLSPSYPFTFFTMKRINLAYWIVTALFSAFMIFSSIGGITLNEQAVAYLHDHMGYPLYFIQIISVAKILGAIAILLPLPARVKEWAYFGFFIDLVVAVFSFIALGDPVAQWAPMFLFIAVLLAAYWLHHKRLAMRATTNN
jgi:DoxX-like family